MDSESSSSAEAPSSFVEVPSSLDDEMPLTSEELASSSVEDSSTSQFAFPAPTTPGRSDRSIVKKPYSTDALIAMKYAEEVTAMPGPNTSKPDFPTPPVARPLMRVARARVAFTDPKYAFVREAVMPEGLPAKLHYRLMEKSFINLKEILNKALGLKINSPSPVTPRKRLSGAGSSYKSAEKPSKKAKKIIV